MFINITYTIKFSKVYFFACWVILHVILSSSFISKKNNYFKTFLLEHYQRVKQWDPDQAHFARPDLGLNSLQSLSADDTNHHSEAESLKIAVMLEW